MFALDYNEFIVPKGSFTWGEYAFLKEWNAFAIPTSANQVNNCKFLFTELQKLRNELGRPIRITSGARTPQYTDYLRSKGIRAAKASAHIDWEAVDICCNGLTTSQLWEFCHKRWSGRMENISFTPGWVHLDIRDWSKRIRFNP